MENTYLLKIGLEKYKNTPIHFLLILIAILSVLFSIFVSTASAAENAPDLIIQDISMDPASPKTRDTVTFTVTYKNQGTLSVGQNFYVSLYVDGSFIKSNSVPDLTAGSSATTNFAWYVGRDVSGGGHRVTAYVDMGQNDGTSVHITEISMIYRVFAEEPIERYNEKISLYIEPRTGQIINQLELNVHSLDLNLISIKPDNIELNYTFQGKTGNATFNLSNDSYIGNPITVDLNQRNDFPFEDYNTTIYISTKDKDFTNNFFLNISNENTTIDSWGQARRLNFHYEGNKIEITMERANKQISEWLYFLGLAIIFSYLICFLIIYRKSPYTSDMFAVFNSFSFLFFVALVISGVREYLFISKWGQLFLVSIFGCFAIFVYKRIMPKNQHNISEIKKEQEISEFKEMLKQNNEEIIEIKEMLKTGLKHDEERNDESIGYMDHQKFERVWKVFTECGDAERHFNNLESQYRKLASTWLLAVFAGFGFLITKEPINIPFDRLLAITIIGLAGSCGVILLWNLDLMVYHKLLNAFFKEGLKLEDDYRWLPQVRHNMMKLRKEKGVEPQIIWFYIAMNSILLMISGVALACLLYKYSFYNAMIVEIVISLFIIFYLAQLMFETTGNVKADIEK